MRTLAIRIAASFLALLVTLGGSPWATAQEAAGVTEERIGAATLDIPADGPASVVLARLALAPGGAATVPAGDGPSAHFLLDGVWEVTGATQAGDLFTVPAGTAAEIRNPGDNPTVVLSAVVAASASGLVSASVPWTPLGEPVPMPPGAAGVTLTRMALDVQAASPSRQIAGPEVYDVREGPVVVNLNPGSAHVLRASGDQEVIQGSYVDPNATPFPEEEEDEGHQPPANPAPGLEMLPGTSIGLDAGDVAVVDPGASRVVQAMYDAPGVVMILAVTPATPLPATPAATP